MGDAAEEAPLIAIESATVWSDDTSVSVRSIPSAAELSDPLQREEPKAPRILIDAELNRKIAYLPRGDLVRVSGHAIVNSTNEMLNERNGLSERILEAAGPQILAEMIDIECRTGEARITQGYNLPADHVIHVVGPRYNVKYRTAAESALHSCYRNVLTLAVEHGLTTIGLPVINSVRRGYPPEAGCHLALRTLRRFLEHHGAGISRVLICPTDEVDIALYNAILPMYFPRDAAEERFSADQLPDDIGDEHGEPINEERRVRIGESRTSDLLNQHNEMTGPSVFDGDRRTADGSVAFADEDELAHSVAASFGEMKGDHDASRVATIAAISKEEEAARRYYAWVRRAKNTDLSDIAATKSMYIGGEDAHGRPIVCIAAKLFDMGAYDKDRTLMYLISFLDGIANKNYVVVFFNADTTSANRPDPLFVRQVYGVLDQKYRRNLKTLYLVHPTWWVRVTVTIMNALFTSDIRDKIRNIETLAELNSVVGGTGIQVPQYVKDYDRQVAPEGAAMPAKAMSQDGL